MSKNLFGLPSKKFIAAAVVAGMIAGAGGVYMIERPSGNGDSKITAANADCAPAQTQIDAIKPYIKGQVAALIPANPPRTLGPMTFKDGTGDSKTLEDLSGKPLLVNLWATWCTPCREEMPALDALQDARGADKQFEVVAISVDNGQSDEKPKKFLEEINVKALNFYHDGTLETFNSLKKQGLVLGLPATLLLNEKGCLLASMNGPAAWSSRDAFKLVDVLIGTNKNDI